jgi:hypothetical protein
MAYVYEINGQRIEFDKEPTDADIDEAAKNLSSAAVGTASMEPPSLAGTLAQGAGSAAATAYGLSGDVVTPKMAYDTLGRPVVQAVGETFQKYVADPFRAGRDIAATKAGSPLPAVNILREAAPGIAEQVGKVSSTAPLTTSPISGAQYPASVPDYRAVQKMAGAEIGQKMTEAYARGGNSAVLEMLDTDKAAQKMMKDPKFAEAVKAYRGQVPSGMGQFGRMAGLAGRTLGRVAGPVGLGLTAYDLYNMAPKMAEMYRTGVQGRGGQLGQTGDEFAFSSGPVEPGYIDDIRRKAAEKVLAQ